jgi:signal transduction histidine kinase
MLNLLVNAWQAMSRQGDMTLASEAVTLSGAFCESYKRRPGRYVHLSLTDTGKGMDEATLARIFEPFFTTKDVGQGTGLGLATVYAIIKHHRGIIRVDSQPGQGSTFHIFLPVSAKAAITGSTRNDAILRGSGTMRVAPLPSSGALGWTQSQSPCWSSVSAKTPLTNGI